MPTATVFVDDDHRVVSPDEATFAIETESDDQGLLVRERWVRIIRSGSPEEELASIVRESERIAAEPIPPGPAALGAFPLWALVVVVASIVVVLAWLLN